jgi:hypothetical protein
MDVTDDNVGERDGAIMRRCVGAYVFKEFSGGRDIACICGATVCDVLGIGDGFKVGEGDFLDETVEIS